MKKYFPDEELDKYSLVRKYLLNESGDIMGKPILWIHTTHNINSRNWPSFYSRNTKQLNQPYKDLCVESIVKRCGDSFHVCLIDDESFYKLLKDWTINISGLSDPVKTHVRELALANVLYEYGGLLLPNSTIVLKDLKEIYEKNIKDVDFFVGEFVNKSDNNSVKRFFPSSKLMGCTKFSKGMKKLINDLEISVSNDNTDQPAFEGLTNKYIYKYVKEGKCGLISGKEIGTKDKEGKEILVEDWLGEASINVCMCSLYCICLPDEAILKRNKYNWFARLNHAQVLEANVQASEFLLLSHGK